MISFLFIYTCIYKYAFSRDYMVCSSLTIFIPGKKILTEFSDFLNYILCIHTNSNSNYAYMKFIFVFWIATHDNSSILSNLKILILKLDYFLCLTWSTRHLRTYLTRMVLHVIRWQVILIIWDGFTWYLILIILLVFKDGFKWY